MLETVKSGKLTIATGEPAYSPWVSDNKRESGKGFEAAVAYAVADELGFDKDDEVWIRSPFDSVISPGAKDFDFNIQQFSISDERKKAVDFSSPYYVTAPAFVSLEGNKGADAKSLADLKGVTIGAAVGTTSLTAVEEDVEPDKKVQQFNSNEDAVQALTQQDHRRARGRPADSPLPRRRRAGRRRRRGPAGLRRRRRPVRPAHGEGFRPNGSGH